MSGIKSPFICTNNHWHWKRSIAHKLNNVNLWTSSTGNKLPPKIIDLSILHLDGKIITILSHVYCQTYAMVFQVALVSYSLWLTLPSFLPFDILVRKLLQTSLFSFTTLPSVGIEYAIIVSNTLYIVVYAWYLVGGGPLVSSPVLPLIKFRIWTRSSSSDTLTF